MYLTKLVFNTYSLDSLQVLQDCNLMHKCICKLFNIGLNQESSRVQWYQDQQVVYIRSEVEPVYPKGFKMTYLQDVPKTVNTGLFEETAFDTDTKGMLQIKLNPVVRCDGKVSRYLKDLDFMDWYVTLLGSNGFAVNPNSIQIIRDYTDNFDHKGSKSKIYTVIARANVKVTDSSKALNAFKHGVGRKKAFGYGMLLYSV